ncbi:TPA: MoaD/ThiS family protein [Candidatus Bathyarchaeota archaeon]|nr:MoaD/ThiS family protein [Candidatus Bathyarchaeota archaeon]
MFPSPQKHTVSTPSTLREFIEGLGAEVSYAYEQRVVVVTVNGEHIWPSVELHPGDVVDIFPIITGG